ncbi:MAG TPA: hypothetical protein VE422_20765 [Terriglobia bacterium]|nr:hypothetical protein [Terriglobia bacterium]
MNWQFLMKRNGENAPAVSGTVAQVVTYYDSIVQKEIDSLVKPLSAEGRKRFDEWIVSKGHLLVGGVINAIERNFEAVCSRADAATRALERADAALIGVAAHIVPVPPVTYIRPVIVAVAFLTCLVAEYQVTLSTIPWFLDLRQSDMVAKALAAIGVAAVTGVEFGFALLLAPYLTGKKTLESSKLFAGLVYGFAAVTVAMNIYMVVLLADGRGAASDTKRRSEESRATLALRAPAGPPLAQKPTEIERMRANELVVDRAIRAMSVAACVDGGLFAVLLMSDFSTLLGAALGSRNMAKRRAERDARTKEWEAAKNARAVLEPEWKRREEQGSQTGAESILAYRVRLQLKLDDLDRKEAEERRLNDTPQQRSLDELIHATLRYELERRVVGKA